MLYASTHLPCLVPPVPGGTTLLTVQLAPSFQALHIQSGKLKTAGSWSGRGLNRQAGRKAWQYNPEGPCDEGSKATSTSTQCRWSAMPQRSPVCGKQARSPGVGQSSHQAGQHFGRLCRLLPVCVSRQPDWDQDKRGRPGWRRPGSAGTHWRRRAPALDRRWGWRPQWPPWLLLRRLSFGARGIRACCCCGRYAEQQGRQQCWHTAHVASPRRRAPIGTRIAAAQPQTSCRAASSRQHLGLHTVVKLDHLKSVVSCHVQKCMPGA